MEGVGPGPADEGGGRTRGEEVGKGGKEREMRRHKHYDLSICTALHVCMHWEQYEQC